MHKFIRIKNSYAGLRLHFCSESMMMISNNLRHAWCSWGRKLLWLSLQVEKEYYTSKSARRTFRKYNFHWSCCCWRNRNLNTLKQRRQAITCNSYLSIDILPSPSKKSLAINLAENQIIFAFGASLTAERAVVINIDFWKWAENYFRERVWDGCWRF